MRLNKNFKRKLGNLSKDLFSLKHSTYLKIYLKQCQKNSLMILIYLRYCKGPSRVKVTREIPFLYFQFLSFHFQISSTINFGW